MALNRGSEWRKWDLHVHTPESIVHEYKKGETEDIWEKYITELENLPSEIKVLGINDYWFLEGYKKVKQCKDNGRLNNIDLLLPIVEFRLRDYVGSRSLNKINYHIIFSNELTAEQIEDEFLKRIVITGLDDRSLTIDNLTEFGKKIRDDTPVDKKSQLPSSNRQIGFNNFTIELSKINELLEKKLFKNKYIKVIGQTEWSDFRWEGSPADKKSLINNCDFVFAASPTVEKVKVSKQKLTEQEVNDNLLHCSDAHEFNTGEMTSKVLGHCYTWIKANPTFEGLKQALYEPERVSLSEQNPNQKSNYQVIKKIKLKGNEDLFGAQTIGLNPDLNSIIGGKSSGKSLLLYHLAKTVMNPEKFNTISSIEGFQKYDDLPEFEVEVIWGDEKISKLSELDNKRPIVYIPQMYLNYMAEKKSRNEDFKQTIDDILKSNDGYSEYTDRVQNEISSYEEKIDNGIRSYFLNIEKLNDLERELHQLGDKSAIIKNIETINHQLEILKNTAGFTEEEGKEYARLNDCNKKLIEEKRKIELKNEFFKDISQKKIKIQENISSFVEEGFSEIKMKYSCEELKKIISDTEQGINNRLDNSMREYIDEDPFKMEEVTSIDQRIVENKGKLKPLIEKFKNQEDLTQKQKDLELEDEKIKMIDSKIQEIENQKLKLKIESIIELYENLLKCYQEVIEKHEEYKNISESIDLLSEIFFNTENFQRDFSDYITKNKTLQTIFETHGFRGNSFVFEIEKHMDNIRYICTKILEDTKSTITFNKGKERKEIIAALFKNYFNISYDLIQEGDRLGHMSPGKKGIILFQLFLHMSSSQDPILIDQPEDNLDNRTVYRELNEFIKEKKLQRQIIIVSHNSNLVVSTDSENIIVAHQNSNSEGQPKFKYINEALENTFINLEKGHILEKQGVREHVCEILEGGVEAFKKREKKYNI